MGAWGIGPYENDEAMDWVFELESNGEPAIESAFTAFDESGPYKDSPDCCIALAASEAIAAAIGKPIDSLPVEVAKWASGQRETVSSTERAHAVVRQIREASELRELWEETDDFAAWLAACDDLIDRLGNVSA